MNATKAFRPSDYQLELPVNDIIRTESPSADAVSFDVLFVGAGPASLAGAIKLSQLVKEENDRTNGAFGQVTIGVLEKSAEVGHHILSGAVINPRAFNELFPAIPLSELPFEGPVKQDAVYFLTPKQAFRLPTPPTMHNQGFYVASLCKVVRWLAEKAQEAGVDILTGFPVSTLLVQGDKTVGVRTTDSGRGRQGEPLSNFQPGTDITAKTVVLGEGTRGYLTQAFLKWQNIQSPNPQIYALGVKEVWKVPKAHDAVVHTMGWPLNTRTFGGSFFYPLKDNHVALGLVVGLDYGDASLDVHYLLQQLKQHPFFRKYLEGGQIVESGAKTIPEGGYWSLPSRLSGSGVLIVGDSAGLVEVASLKGVHYAMASGILAAETLFEALKSKNFSDQSLAAYDQKVRDSFIHQDLYRRRNMRLAFKEGFWLGSIKAGLSLITGGALFGGRVPAEPDSRAIRNGTEKTKFSPDGKLTFSKLDMVNQAGNSTRDNIPSHLLASKEINPALAEFYASVCPAGVYEVVEGSLRINPPNCIDCKATDVVAPRWSPREGGSGPRYTRM